MKGQPITIHGWIYDVADGLLRDMGVTAERNDETGLMYRKAVEAVKRRGAT
jgi:carbonic anhydrase